ncbi:MAG: hypothetical protein ABJL99_17430 [Aliishimia sp.]
MSLKTLTSAAILTFASATVVQAIPVNWLLDYANTVDNTTINGSFTYDADFAQFSNIDVISLNDFGVGTGVQLTVDPIYATTQSPFSFAFSNNDAQNRNGVPSIVFNLDVALSNTGGVLTDNFTITPFTCRSADCVTFDERPQGTTGTGTLIGVPAIPVPLSASFTFVCMGVLAIGVLRLRKRL